MYRYNGSVGVIKVLYVLTVPSLYPVSTQTLNDNL